MTFRQSQDAQSYCTAGHTAKGKYKVKKYAPHKLLSIETGLKIQPGS